MECVTIPGPSLPVLIAKMAVTTPTKRAETPVTKARDNDVSPIRWTPAKAIAVATTASKLMKADAGRTPHNRASTVDFRIALSRRPRK